MTRGFSVHNFSYYAFRDLAHSNFSALYSTWSLSLSQRLVLFLWFLLLTIFFTVSEWLLISILILEIITFYILVLSSLTLSAVILSDILVLALFRVFVIEGVVALAGLIILVRFSGRDYVSSSSILKC